MSVTAETLVHTILGADEAATDGSADRRSDIDAKQIWVAALLQEVGCEGLLILDADNFGCLTSGAAARGILNPADLPALYFSAEGRWVISSNVESQRLFDEELDGLGFQLKEWPWHWGREQLLADLCQGRNLAFDDEGAAAWVGGRNGDPARGNGKVVAKRLKQMRCALTAYERACFRALGASVSHALEATCRTMTPGETEREIAGQLSHRLMHRGVYPVLVGVAADGRARRYRHHGFTAAPVLTSCVVSLTARKYGLCATASRAVSFGPPEPLFRKEHNAVCKVTATYMASSWPDAVPREILGTGRRVYLLSGAEHEWLLSPQGHVTGRAPVELLMTPKTEELFQDGWGVTWTPTVGAASSCDTFLITADGPETITPTENWPVKRIRIQGADFSRPDILER